jgi:hypothetical protein
MKTWRVVLAFVGLGLLAGLTIWGVPELVSALTDGTALTDLGRALVWLMVGPVLVAMGGAWIARARRSGEH